MLLETNYSKWVARAEAEGVDAYLAGVFPEEAEAVCHYIGTASAYLWRAWFRGYDAQRQKTWGCRQK